MLLARGSGVLLVMSLMVACASKETPAPATAPAPTPAPAPMTEAERETQEAQVQLTRSIASGLMVGAAMLRLNPGSSCPTADQIVEAGLVSPALRSRDMWNTPYRITCTSGDHVAVASAGPDLTFGTDDDIVVSDR